MTGKMDTGFFARLWLASLCARVCVFIVSLSLYYRLTGNMRVRVCWLDSLLEEVSRDLYISYFSQQQRHLSLSRQHR